MADQFRNQSILKGWMSHVIYYLHSIVHTHLVRFFTTLTFISTWGCGIAQVRKSFLLIWLSLLEELLLLLIRTQNCFNFVSINEIFFWFWEKVILNPDYSWLNIGTILDMSGVDANGDWIGSFVLSLLFESFQESLFSLGVWTSIAKILFREPPISSKKEWRWRIIRHHQIHRMKACKCYHCTLHTVPWFWCFFIQD